MIKNIQVEVITYEEFVNHMTNNTSYYGNKVILDGDTFYISNGNGVEYELLPTDVLLIFKSGQFVTISKDDL